MRIVPRAGAPALEVTVSDGRGSVVGVFLGRRRIAGLSPGRKVAFEGQFAPVTINARDATTIGIVLGELITNALKHAFEPDQPGTIWAKFSRNEDGTAVLTVEDDGKGLTEEGAKSESGLGAMIVKQLARQFGGQPRYEAREGGGTRVSVSLPELDRSTANP